MKLFESNIKDEDLKPIIEVIRSGEIGFGENVHFFEKEFSSFSNKKFNISTNSASAAAFMIFSYLKDKYGICDVYTTSLSFTSPIWAAKHFGHNIFFVDVQDDLQFSAANYKKIRKYNQNKIVVMPLLYGGVSTIKDFDLFGDEIVVVDSAHCATPTIKCDYIFFSFHPYKPICTSDGGMISTNEEEANNYFLSYRNFGRKQKGLSYEVVSNGFKFYMNNLNATIGLTQLKRYKELLEIRKINYKNLAKKYDLLPHDEHSSFYFATTLTKEADDIMIEKNINRLYPMLHKMSYYDNGQKLINLESKHNLILNLSLYRQEQ